MSSPNRLSSWAPKRRKAADRPRSRQYRLPGGAAPERGAADRAGGSRSRTSGRHPFRRHASGGVRPGEGLRRRRRGDVRRSVLRVRAGEEWPAEVTAAEPPKLSVPSAPRQPSPSSVERGRLRRNGPLPLRRTAERARPPHPKAPGTSIASRARPSSQAVFEQATALERSDPARASQLYRALESGGDSWAQNALYARGRLAASRGNPVEARRLLEQYLERFPRGSNAEDARAVLRRLR